MSEFLDNLDTLNKIISDLRAERDALRADLAAARSKTIEECAAICDARYMGDNNREDREALACAAAIRALKGDDNG